MNILMTTINIPVVPFISAIWFVGYLLWELGRCSATHDIMDAGVSGKMPDDIESWRISWIEKHKNRK